MWKVIIEHSPQTSTTTYLTQEELAEVQMELNECGKEVKITRMNEAASKN